MKMNEAERGQLQASAARIYEDFFVPALFQEPAQYVANTIRPHSGEAVLDVACGTGILTRELARAGGPQTSCTGLDCNKAMLEIASQLAPGIQWQSGFAEELPFGDDAFGRSYCNFGLMFFDDRTRALREMARVTASGGTVCAATWDSLDHSPGYAAICGLLRRLFGVDVARALEAPFVLGDRNDLQKLFAAAELPELEIDTVEMTARFASLDDWLHTDIRGWTLTNMIDDEQLETLRREAQKNLNRFVAADGTVAFNAPMHVAVANL